MPNSKDVFKWVVEQISLDETPDEIRSIAYVLLEKKFNVSRSKIIAPVELAEFNQNILSPFIERINIGEPIQYIIGSQDFYGRSFKVNPSVLIPRPETEQLVYSVIEYAKKSKVANFRLLDIGTGSGCIPITLQLELGNIEGTGIDISESAIDCAIENSKLHHTSIQFSVSDVLNDPLPEHHFDIIVSNPPYVQEKEKIDIKANVLDFEPHTALFVPDDDPLKFYKSIVKKSETKLNKGGLLALEINENFGRRVVTLLKEHSFRKVEIIQDLASKDRIVHAIY